MPINNRKHQARLVGEPRGLPRHQAPLLPNPFVFLFPKSDARERRSSGGRAQPSSLVRSLMIERRAIAAHLQRVVMRRSNRKGNATAPPSRITIQARDHLIELRRHAVTLGSRRQDDAPVPPPHHPTPIGARSDTTHQSNICRRDHRNPITQGSLTHNSFPRQTQPPISEATNRLRLS